jgi:NRPS condensation-like uncharacterized protein
MVVLVGGIRYFTQKLNSAGRSRSLSFSSEILIAGAFPEKARVHQAIINVVFYVAKCPSVEAVQKQVKKMLFFDRFRSGLIQGFFTWRFTDLGIDSNIERMLLDTIEYADEDALRAGMDELAVQKIEYVSSKPIWKIIRMVNTGNGRSALMFRMHHALGDGIAQVGMMPIAFEQANGEPFPLDIPEKMGGGSSMKFSLGFIGNFLKTLFEVLMVPSSKYDSDLSMSPGHSPQYFYNEKTTSRKTVTIQPIRLDFIKQLKNKGKGTVNDVLMSATSGMIRRYSLFKNDPLIPTMEAKTNVQTRSLVAVAFPRTKKELASPSQALRNNFSLISVPMAINETSALDRFKASVKITTEMKKSPAAILQLWIQTNLVAMFPRFMQQQIAFDAFSRHSLVFSNVPGPNEHLYFCGEKLLDVHVIFPNMLNQIILMSYAGYVHFTMSCDAKEIDSAVISTCFCDELRALAKDLGVDASKMF